jgi:DNA-binding XRE family transcriptional regulator
MSESASLKVTPLEPIGRSTHRGFGHLTDGTPIYEWEADDYPPPSELALKFRNVRQIVNLGLRETASRLGISVVDLSSLERGRATCDWEHAFRLLAPMAFHTPPHPRLNRSDKED